MADITVARSNDPGQIFRQMENLLDANETLLTQMANAAALLYWSLRDVNWAGFYLRTGEYLQLGPFQGKPACTVISPGSGVCGTAAAENRTLVVPDVHAFAGHIVCDPESRSEVVVPLRSEDGIWGVLDVDSPVEDRFQSAEVELFERTAALIDRRRITAEGMLFPA